MIIDFSFLSVKSEEYKKYIKEYNTFSSDWLHFDVMDGEFVKNVTYDYKLVKKINKYNNLFCDVHLMCSNDNLNIDKYIKAGAKQITFHYEALNKLEIEETINKIKNKGIRVGMSVCPDTDISVLEPYLDKLDFVLVMSVVPGKGGQTFIETSLDKIKYLVDLKPSYHYLVGVDGGIDDETIKLVKEAGADVVVVGSYLVNNFNISTYNSLKLV